MKIWNKSILIFGAAIFLLFSSITASAASVDDDPGDVFHWRTTDTGFDWEYSTNKPNVDITGASCDVGADTITLSLTVDGSIVDDPLVSYTVTYSNSDSSSSYAFTYSDGTGTSFYSTPTDGGFGTTPAITNSDTISCTISGTIEDTSDFELEAITYQYTTMNDITKEYWTDDATGSGTDDGDDDGIGYDKAYQDPSKDVEEDYMGENPTTTNDYPGLDILYVETDDNDVDEVTAKLVLAGSPLKWATYKIHLFDTLEGHVADGTYSEGWGKSITYQEQIEGSSDDTSVSGNTITWVFDREYMYMLESAYDVEASCTYTAPGDVKYRDLCNTDDSTEVNVGTGPAESGYGDGDGDDDDGSIIGGNDEKKDGTPGFETIALIAAIAIALIVFRRKK